MKNIKNTKQNINNLINDILNNKSIEIPNITNLEKKESRYKCTTCKKSLKKSSYDKHIEKCKNNKKEISKNVLTSRKKLLI